MPGSRLLPPERRSPLPAAPTTSRRWRTHVLVRSWLNRHRQHWLAPLLVCAPPVGVAMVWAGATRPGHARRWLTAAALVWSIVVLLTVVLVTFPSAPPADAGDAPRTLAGGAAPATPDPTTAATRDAASVAAEVRGAPAVGAGVAAAGVETSAPTDPDPAPTGDDGGTASSAAPPPAAAAVPTTAPTGAAPPVSTPRRSTAPAPPRATPTPTPPPRRTPTRVPDPPSLPTANPFTACAVEGAHAVSPNGLPLRCFRTPIGLYWLWGQ